MLLSSLAESVYWFARYIERSENIARMILVNDGLLLDIPPHCNPGWAPLVHISGGSDLFYRHYDAASERNVIRYLAVDRDNNPSAMLNCVVNARENFRAARALFPKPVWEVLNNLHTYVEANQMAVLLGKQRYGFLRQVIDLCHLIGGKLATTMSHDDIYEFARMGFNLERADMTSRVIDVRAQSMLKTGAAELQPFEDIQWKSVLDSLAAWQMYRRSAPVRINGVDVLHFLLKDRHFPRAVSHCLMQLEQSLYALAGEDIPRQALSDARRKVNEVNVGAIVGDQLHRYVDELQLQFIAMHDELALRYFAAGDEPPAAASDTGPAAPGAVQRCQPPAGEVAVV